MPYSIRGTDNVYLAMKAMLTAVKEHNKVHVDDPIKHVACTGLGMLYFVIYFKITVKGTFYGRMDFAEAARQMALAYRNFVNPPSEMSWTFASQRQAEVKFGGESGFRMIEDAREDAGVTEARGNIQADMAKLAEETAHTNK